MLASRHDYLAPAYGGSALEMGRTEHRMDVSLAGRLETGGESPLRERVRIRNLSSHGARVISDRPWQARDQVNLAEAVGDYHLDAEVIYCERLPDNRYAVGLKFASVARQNSQAHSRSYW